MGADSQLNNMWYSIVRLYVCVEAKKTANVDLLQKVVYVDLL